MKISGFRLMIFVFTMFGASAGLALSAENPKCEVDFTKALKTLQTTKYSYEERSAAGECLATHHFAQGAVSKAIISVIRNREEEILLREDLMMALSHLKMRKSERVDEKLGPEVGTVEKNAIDRTLASAGEFIAITSAVKAMDDTVPVSKAEPELLRALNHIAIDETEHVLLRSAAIESLQKLIQGIVASGVYQDKIVQLSMENLRILAARDDNFSYYSGASKTYEVMEQDPAILLALEGTNHPERAISSEK